MKWLLKLLFSRSELQPHQTIKKHASSSSPRTRKWALSGSSLQLFLETQRPSTQFLSNFLALCEEVEASEGLEYREQLGRPALHPGSDVIIVICEMLETAL